MMFRKRIFHAVLVLSATALLTTTLSARVYENQEQAKPYIIPGRVTVVFQDGITLEKRSQSFGRANFGIPTLDNLLDKVGATGSEPIFRGKQARFASASGEVDLSRYYEISFPEDRDVRDVVRELQQNPNLKVVEPVWALPLLASPNDPSWASQWAMHSPPPDANFYTAWDTETGSDCVIYANIDSGTHYRHRDLEPNVWVNPGEDLDGDGYVYDTDDLNGVDDDGNGVIDDLIGYDFMSGLGTGTWPGEDAAGPDPDPLDFDGHGSHVAGIVAAAVNNGLDVTGAAGGWYGGHRSMRGVRIMALRVGGTGADGLGYVNSNNCGTAIEYAAENGAKVINCSWGSSGTTTMNAGMAACAAMGVTVCHAAGNDNNEVSDFLDSDPFTGVLSVASVGPNSDVKSGFSSYGFWVDVSAPGSSILSTYSNQYTPTTATLSGTSMASPMVAGLACLIRSAAPGLSKEQVDSIIKATADNIDGVNNPAYAGKLGTGRINAVSALANLPLAKFTSTPTDGNIPWQVDFTDASPGSPSSWIWSFGDGDSSSMQNPSHTYTEPGIYDVSLEADAGNSLGPAQKMLKRYVWTRADTIKIDSVKGTKGAQVTVPVRLTNTSLIKEVMFAFQIEGTSEITYASHNVTGLRTSYFSSVSLDGFESASKIALRMQSSGSGQSHYLEADTGAILNLVFDIPSDIADGVYIIDSATVASRVPNLSSIYGNYWPVHIPGKIVIGGCCVGIRDNCDGVGGPSILDVNKLVSWLFGGGTTPPCLDECNADGMGGYNIIDVTRLVSWLFAGGTPVAACP